MERIGVTETNCEKMKTWVGYNNNHEVRFAATSGGVGSAIIKYLFEKQIIDGAISFTFDKTDKKFASQIVYSYNDYSLSGSIYHEIDIIRFLKDADIENRSLAVFCLPCQTRAVRKILYDKGCNTIILGLTCSSQQTYEATEYLFKRLGINKDSVKSFQYRGNGWPGGIGIALNDKTENIRVPNNGSIWTRIFHSRLFIRKKCWHCIDTLNSSCDILLADPWLKEYIENEKTGQTLFSAYTESGKRIIENAIEDGFITATAVDNSVLEQSQKGTIERKKSYGEHRKLVNIIFSIYNSRLYRRIILSSNWTFKCHYKFNSILEKYMRNN